MREISNMRWSLIGDQLVGESQKRSSEQVGRGAGRRAGREMTIKGETESAFFM